MRISNKKNSDLSQSFYLFASKPATPIIAPLSVE